MYIYIVIIVNYCYKLCFSSIKTVGLEFFRLCTHNNLYVGMLHLACYSTFFGLYFLQGIKQKYYFYIKLRTPAASKKFLFVTFFN